MKQRAQGAWITLNSSYYCAPACDVSNLLDDASLLLSGARGITQSLSDLLNQGVDIEPGDLASALWGASVLIQLGQSSAEEAHVRIRKIRGSIRAVDDGS
jgi:hypothetical protein